MATTKLRAELEAAKIAVARLEKSLVDSLAALPARYGFDSVKEFVAALTAASGGRTGGKKGAKAGKKRLRAKITDETRASVKKLVKAGKTGAEISKTLKISTASVQNIRKALGLTRGSAKAEASKSPAA